MEQNAMIGNKKNLNNIVQSFKIGGSVIAGLGVALYPIIQGISDGISGNYNGNQVLENSMLYTMTDGLAGGSLGTAVTAMTEEDSAGIIAAGALGGGLAGGAGYPIGYGIGSIIETISKYI